jgi:hypothetical protein
MSVRWMRTATIGKGKFMEAVSWGKEVSGYAEKKWGIPPVHVWVDAFGPAGVIRWTVDFADLAAVEKMQLASMADQSYWQMVDKAVKAELFIEGSVVDTVTRSV